MTKLLACLLGMLVSLQAGQAPAAADKPKDEKCSIEGRVVNSVTSEAVRRVSLMLGPSGATSTADVRQAESDENGQFAFQDLNPGRYTLLAQRTGFALQAYGARSNPQNGTPLVLSAGQQVKGLLFKLPPNAVISGRVLDSEGEPMGNVAVVALRPGYQRGERQWLPLGTAQSNDVGEFRIASLGAGSYVVAATSGLTAASLLGTSGKAASDKPVLGNVMTYYPNATDAAGATPVAVGVGAEVRIADIRMLKAPTVRVSGKLSGDSEGKAAIVRLVPKGAGLMGILTGKMTIVQQAGGAFELRGVPAGSYTLSGMSSDLQTPMFGAQTIQVGSGGELPGVVAVEGKDTVNLEKAQVQLQPRDFVVLSAPRGTPGEGGKFTLKNVAADRYLVQVNNGPEGTYLKSVRFGGQEITEEGLDLTGGVAGSLQITLSPEAAQVDGVVQDADNKPVTGATVVLIPESRRFSLYKEEHSDQNGRFSMKGVTPGAYKILAWEDIETGAFYDPEFLKKYESKAESLSLKPSDRRNLQLKAIPFEKLP